jgi:CheY-like chemotaxis protein
LSCRRILIVEDDEAIRAVLQFALVGRGYALELAANGREGIEKLRRINEPCLILLDLMMPEMDGWEFAQALMDDPALCKNPILLLTASREKVDSIPYKELLKKPLDIHCVFAAVARYCEVPGGLAC